MAHIILEQIAYITRIENSYVNFTNEGDNMNLSSCKTRKDMLEKTWSKFETNHYSLFADDNYEELIKHIYFTDNIFGKTEEKYLKSLSDFQLYLDSHQCPPVHSMLESSLLPQHNMRLLRNTGVSDETERLPRISLPEFDSDFKKWESFRDIFSTLVVDRVNLPNVTKLRHLRSCLKGDAENLVKSYSITDENFLVVWEKLKNRYEVKKRLVNSHVSAIFAIKPINMPSATELKRILDGVNTPISALKVLQRPVDNWDDLLVFHVVSLSDSETKKQWEIYNNNFTLAIPSTSTLNNVSSQVPRVDNEPPSFSKLTEFLERQISILESIEENYNSLNVNFQSNFKNSNVSTQPAKVFHTQTEPSRKFSQSNNNKAECLICKNAHHFSQCDSYKSKSIEQRIEFVKSQRRCFNCLGNHYFNKCPSLKRCNTCGKKHHTTLHLLKRDNKSTDNNKNSVNTANLNSEVRVNSDQNLSESQHQNISSNICETPSQVLLSTAVVRVVNEDGGELYARALVDQGSQASFISESLFKRLHIAYKSIRLPISGVGGKNSFVCKKIVTFVLKSRFFYSDFALSVDAYVIPKITSYSPTADGSSTTLDHIRDLILADPGFCKRGQIELLLGASVHASIIEGEVLRGTIGEPIAMNSKLGWIISGNSGIGSTCCLSIFSENDSSNFFPDLERFWQQEEVGESSAFLLNPDEQECENYFVHTHSRNPEGRYIVRLPFKVKDTSEIKFPGSFVVAKNMLLKMESRFSNDSQFRKLYVDFMKDYKVSQHMKLSEALNDIDSCYFLPHHGVLKKYSLQPKLRTVFNGSAKDFHKLSINDVLHVGANLLPDLAELLIGWMMYRYVFVSDVEQMFRQILIHKDDQKFQQILWRFNSGDKIDSWSLQTVTYGIVSSPYLPIRVT